MKTLQRIFPFIAVVGVLAGAIYYVVSSQPPRPEPAPVAKAAQSVQPPSARYADTHDAAGS